jgi:hypothetical protein
VFIENANSFFWVGYWAHAIEDQFDEEITSIKVNGPDQEGQIEVSCETFQFKGLPHEVVRLMATFYQTHNL